MVVLNILLNLFLGFLLYLAITVLIIGTIFVIRTALMLFFGFDLYEWLKNLVSKKKKTKKKVILNEDSDKEWLESRGRG